jgi:hypothetical protein
VIIDKERRALLVHLGCDKQFPRDVFLAALTGASARAEDYKDAIETALETTLATLEAAR